MSQVINITNQEQYFEFKTSHKKAIIFYGASWCQGCTEIKPLYERIAFRYSNRITFAFIDVDKCKPDFDKIPVFVSFVNGKQIDALEGGIPEKVKELIRNAIKTKIVDN